MPCVSVVFLMCKRAALEMFMLTWDECYRQGLSKREAAFEMNCDAKTASRALKMAGERVREYAAMNAARNARDLHRIAHAETRPKSERSSYPVPLLEISDLNLGDAVKVTCVPSRI